MKRETFDMQTLKNKLSEMHEHSHDEGCCDHDDYNAFVEKLPLPVRRRIFALEQLHSKRASIAAEYRDEMLKIERKFLAKYAPLNEERAKIVGGVREPTTEELNGFAVSGVEEVSEAGSSADNVSGIPAFWIQAMKNHPDISTLIAESDLELLAALKDIRVSYFADKPGFKLEFDFAPNDFFSNTTLTKEYHLANPEEGDQDDFVYDHAVGTEISWKGSNNLCFKTVVRTQRHRTNNSSRTVKRQEMLNSFFHFFIPPVMPVDEEEEEDNEDDMDELEARIRMDYEIGEVFKSTLIPNAVDWFTGKAHEYAEFEDDYYGEDDEFDEEDENDEDDDEEDEDEESGDDSEPEPIRSKGGKQPAGKQNQECKQQ